MHEKITIQAQKNPHKSCSHHILQNKTLHHSLFLAVIQNFGIALKSLKQEKGKSLNHDKPGKSLMLWNGYMRTKILVEILSYDNFLSIV